MKKLLSTMLTSVMLLITLNPVFADSDLDVLTKAMINTFEEDRLSLDVDLNLNYGDSNIAVNETAFFDDEKTSVDSSLDFQLNSSDLPEEIAEEAGSDFLVKTGFNASSFIDSKNGDIYGQFSSPYLNLETEDEDLKAIVEGFFEPIKIFSEKYYYINIQDFLEILGDELPYMYGMDDIPDMTLTRDDIVKMIEIFMQSGLFEVTKSGNTYTVTLTDDFSNIHLQDVLTGILDLSFISVDMKESLMNDFSAEDFESMQVQGAMFYAMAQEFFVFESSVVVSNNKIKSVEENLVVKLSNINEELKDLEIKAATEVKLNTKQLFAPNKTTVVNLNKTLEAFVAVQERGQKMRDAQYVQREEMSQNYLREELESNADWYTQYAVDLVNKNLIRGSFNPADTFTVTELSEMLHEVNGSVEIVYYWEDKGEDLVSKLEGVKRIVNAVRPDVKNPVKFAKDNNIISSVNINQLKEEKMNMAVMAKVLSMTLATVE